MLTYKGRAESECKLPADIVMLATGRSANTSNLGLQVEPCAHMPVAVSSFCCAWP